MDLRHMHFQLACCLAALISSFVCTMLSVTAIAQGASNQEIGYPTNNLATPARLPSTQTNLPTGRAGVMQQNPFKLSRQEILRMLLGGSSSMTNKNPTAIYGARDNLQLASDAAAQAEAACSRAYYASSRDEALSAAAAAQNQASVARAAADRATQAASDGSSEASGAASAAHSEASRAQAAADRATAHAHGATW